MNSFDPIGPTATKARLALTEWSLVAWVPKIICRSTSPSTGAGAGLQLRRRASGRRPACRSRRRAIVFCDPIRWDAPSVRVETASALWPDEASDQESESSGMELL